MGGCGYEKRLEGDLSFSSQIRHANAKMRKPRIPRRAPSFKRVIVCLGFGYSHEQKNILKIAGDLNSTLKIDRKKPKKENYKKVVSELI